MNLNLDKSFFYAILVFCFLLPIRYMGASYMIAVSTIIWLLQSYKQKKIKITWSPFLILMVSFLLIQLFGVLISDNQTVALQKVETKLSFLIFPLILLSQKAFSSQELRKIKQAFVLGAITLAIITIGWAAYQYFFLGANSNIFFRFKLLSLGGQHPTYIGLHIAFAVILVFYDYLFLDRPLFKNQLENLLIVLFLLFYIALANSRINILALICILPLGFLIHFFKKGQIMKGIGLSLALIGLVFLINFSFSINSERFSKMSKDSRPKMWACTFEPIKENWLLGVGPGDLNEVLGLEYIKNGLEGAQKHQYNAHNLVLQTLMANGVIGLILLLSILLLLLFYFWKSKDYLLLFFLILILISGLTESTFNRSAGTMFFGFFASLLVLQNTKKRNNTPMFVK